MRVSFLVLSCVIAVYSSNTDAKAVKFVTEDELKSISQSPIKADSKNTSCTGTVTKSNDHGEEHVLRKRDTSADLGRKISFMSKKENKKKIDSRKYKHEEHKTKTVSSKTHSIKKDKVGTGQKDEDDQGRTNLRQWYLPHQMPYLYNNPGRVFQWSEHSNTLPYSKAKDYESNTLTPRDIIKMGELTGLLRKSFKKGIDCWIDSVQKELKKKLTFATSPVSAKHSATFNSRSSCIDTGDGSCENESNNGAYEPVSTQDCSDDTPEPTNNGLASNDLSKRSDSPVDFIKEMLPLLIQAAESILNEGNDSKNMVPGGIGSEVGGAFSDEEIDDEKFDALSFGDGVAEAAKPDADDEINNTRSAPWDIEDINSDNVPVEW